ncbi:MAG: hypothetical protein HZB10_00430 [Candidatus Yonathbacteria bacterium]|nr:hypothetical protein [Candidatus Yonathbacteria bacterium]
MDGRGSGKLTEMTEYHLEVYEPGSAEDVLTIFKSINPFMAIKPGDLLGPYVWGAYPPGAALRIINVEHGVWEVGGKITHKILVFTEEVEGTPELRLTQWLQKEKK